MGQVDHSALCAPADGPCQVEGGGKPGSRREDKGSQRRQRLIGLVHDPLELDYPGGGEVRLLQRLSHALRVRSGEVTANREEVSLNALQELVEEPVPASGPNQSDG